MKISGRSKSFDEPIGDLQDRMGTASLGGRGTSRVDRSAESTGRTQSGGGGGGFSDDDDFNDDDQYLEGERFSLSKELFF